MVPEHQVCKAQRLRLVPGWTRSQGTHAQARVRAGEGGVHVGKELTWAENVRRIAADHGRSGLTEDDIDVALWEHTAFPMAPREEVERQLHELFAGAR